MDQATCIAGRRFRRIAEHAVWCYTPAKSYVPRGRNFCRSHPCQHWGIRGCRPVGWRGHHCLHFRWTRAQPVAPPAPTHGRHFDDTTHRQSYRPELIRTDRVALRDQLVAGRSGGAAVPAASVPMSTKVDRFSWDGDDVADAPFDVTVAPGAQVELDRLVRLHETGLGVCPKSRRGCVWPYRHSVPSSGSSCIVDEYRFSHGLVEVGFALLSQCRDTFGGVGAHETQHLVGQAGIESRCGLVHPQVECPFGQPGRLL